MKVIELLNKIANGEEVLKKIKINNIYLDRFEYSTGNGHFVYSYKNEISDLYLPDFIYPQNLNDEVEIISDKQKFDSSKKIEKLETYKLEDCDEYFNNILKVSKNGEYEITEDMSVVIDKLNEVIDYINKEKKNV